MEVTAKTKDGKEFWVKVQADFTGKYFLTVVERKAMAQAIEANADVFSDSLRTTGHAAVYGIHANMVRTFDMTVRKLAGTA